MSWLPWITFGLAAACLVVALQCYRVAKRLAREIDDWRHQP